MKGKKDGIIWSIVLIVFSIIIFFVLQFHLYTDGFKNIIRSILPFKLSEWREFFMVIMSGIFTSSFVTLIMNCSDYKNEKRDALENYFLVSIKFLFNIFGLKYLYIEEDIELIRNYYRERSANNLYKRKGNFQELNYKAKLELQEWIWKNESKNTRKRFRKVKSQYLMDCLEKITSKYDQELDEIAAQYKKISEFEFREVDDALRKIDFLFTNKSNRNMFIYKFLYGKQRDLLNKIESCNFNEIEENEYKKAIILDKILNIQDEIFVVEDNKFGKSIYNQYYYEIRCNLEFLLQIIYGNKYKENYPQKIHSLSSTHIDKRIIDNILDLENQD